MEDCEELEAGYPFRWSPRRSKITRTRSLLFGAVGAQNDDVGCEYRTDVCDVFVSTGRMRVSLATMAAIGF